MKLIKKMDANNDGCIEWHEFLYAMWEWLDSTGSLKDGNMADTSLAGVKFVTLS